MNIQSKKLKNLLLTILMGASIASANAASFPQKPITLIVPFAPGGGTDSIARDLSKTLSEKLGQSVVVDNRGGGGGSIGASMGSKAAPDGYTLLFVTSTFVTHAATDESAGYNIEKDYAPVAMIGRGPLLVVSNKSVPVKTLSELIQFSNQTRDINYCSAGLGSINHLSGELFKQKTGANLTHIPYKGSGPATIDLLAGRVQVFFATIPTILPYVETDRVNVLAITSEKRSPLFPNVPTAAEAGVPGFNLSTWWGIVAPAGTPQAIVKKLNESINDAASKDPLKSRLAKEGAQAYKVTPAEFQKILSSELKLWQSVVKSANIKID
ncbi:tripartite tricarboxylate transporter substrate binding protein [Polynucleobacter sp. MWH-Aus1W21]|uniref:tripartite tricarboxylate transporter substrate binding protein n=1 Tax=Polynucleobacter sp. MWH-Aus1W21 TaxID=1855880 RepID=UPI00203D7E30|nr:tripartite tricarboxylate transporter substrate binding protein [Polynucleobacter sp. MWH-Aus1W21]